MGQLTVPHLSRLGAGITHFVETGTYHGDTLLHAVEYARFDSIQSVELDQALYEFAARRLRGVANVRLYRGNSVELLPIIVDPARATLFWLDAHYTGPNTSAMPSMQCPLLKELEAILAMDWLAPYRIVIDDAGAFNPKWWKANSRPHQLGYIQAEWPVEQDIFTLLHNHGCAWVTRLDHNWIEVRNCKSP